MSAKGGSQENVYLFIPNLIGYVRAIAGVLAFYYYQDCGIFWTLYFISYFLDCLDGYAARYFGQATRFGQMLDMITDRCCTACLFSVLASVYDEWNFVFQMLIALDVGSHYCHVFSQLLSGTASHKKLADNESWLLKLYYHNQKVLFAICFMNESFFVILYVLRFQGTCWFADQVTGIFTPAAYVFFPVAVLKQVLNLLQFLSACRKIVDYDVSVRSGKIKDGK